MIGDGHALFDTAIGRCGIAWTQAGVSLVQLPEAGSGGTSHQTTPPAAIQSAITAITALLNGAAETLAEITLDLAGVSEFDRRVYQETRAIPPGATLTYGQLAARIGDAQAARAVGRALGRNPVPIIVPCHRVLAAGAGTGGFSAPGGITTKLRLLEIEGVRLDRQMSLFA